MKALVLRGPAPMETAPLRLEEVTIPEPGPGELLLRVRACGLCHTDLHIAEGELPLPKLPVVLGHQVVGTVERRGRGAGSCADGDRMGVGWLHRACGRCSWCRGGKENLCQRAQFTGYHVDGGYAEYAVVPQQFAYPIPDGFSDEQAAPLLCGGVIGYRAFRQAEARPGQVLGVYGFGSSAHIVIQVALSQGCRVHVFSRSPAHQGMARRMGATWVGKAEDGGREELDSAIIFAPAGELVPLALGSLKRGGTLALAGITMSNLPEMPYRLLYGERTVRSVANATRDDAHALLRLAAEIPIRTEVEVFPLEKANEGLLRLKQGRINGAGVLTILPP